MYVNPLGQKKDKATARTVLVCTYSKKSIKDPIRPFFTISLVTNDAPFYY